MLIHTNINNSTNRYPRSLTKFLREQIRRGQRRLVPVPTGRPRHRRRVAEVNVDRDLRGMDHPHHPRGATGVVAVNDVAVRVGEGGGGLVGDAGQEGSHFAFFAFSSFFQFDAIGRGRGMGTTDAVGRDMLRARTGCDADHV